MALNQRRAVMEQRRIAAGDQVIGREKALAACEETYLQVARTTEALFALAGEKELARRVRPPVRQSGRRREREPLRRLLPRPAAWLRGAAVSIWQWLRDLQQTLVWRLARGSLKARIA